MRPALAVHGGDRKSEEVNQGNNVTLKTRGNDNTYLAARIKRDAPEIAARVAAGEFKSIRAAAIEAGIVKVATPLDALKRAWGKASAEDQRQFLDWISNE